MTASRTVRRWILVVAWMCFIFVSSSRPGSDVPSGIAPFAHFLVYAVLGALVLSAFDHPSRWVAAVLIASAYGVTDEFHQAYVPGRTPDPVDWLLDTVGALAGATLIAWWLARKTTEDS